MVPTTFHHISTVWSTQTSVPHFLHRVGPLPFRGGWTSRANDLGRRERAPEGSHNLKHKENTKKNMF